MYICEIVSSIRNKDKINVYGYMMLKDKNRNHKYYWHCEKRDILKCSGRATTILTEDQHHLVNASEHNHAAEANRVKVINKINVLKESAQQSNDQPAQIIQTAISDTTNEVYPYLPSHDALRQVIKRVRHIDTPVEPQSLESLIIPEDMKKTLNGVDFLVKDSIVDNKRVLMFTTSANINYLAQSSIWIMDGTFKTVPTIFRQLYTIHG